MPRLKLTAFVLILTLVASGCASTQSAPPPPLVCPRPPAPPAWTMAPPPDLLTPLNGIISTYDPE